MTMHSRNNGRFGENEGKDMNSSEAHGKSIISFRQAHADSQKVAVVEQETFEEHDAKSQ